MAKHCIVVELDTGTMSLVDAAGAEQLKGDENFSIILIESGNEPSYYDHDMGVWEAIPSEPQ